MITEVDENQLKQLRGPALQAPLSLASNCGSFGFGVVYEEFDRSVWGFTSIASAVWLFKRENVRAAHLDGLLFPFGPQTDNPRIYRLSAVGP